MRRISRPMVLVRWLGVAVICAIAVAYVQPIRAYMSAKEEVAGHKAQRAALLRQQASLRHRLEQAGTDEFIVREARRIGLVLPGERLYIVKGVQKWRKARLR